MIRRVRFQLLLTISSDVTLPRIHLICACSEAWAHPTSGYLFLFYFRKKVRVQVESEKGTRVLHTMGCSGHVSLVQETLLMTPAMEAQQLVAEIHLDKGQSVRAEEGPCELG